MRTRTHRTAWMLAPLLAFAVGACGDDGDTIDPVDDPDEEPAVADPSGDWVMVDGPMGPIDGWDVTVTIDGDEIGGRAACNSYGGTVQWSADGSFSVGELAQTEMACEPATVMELESAFLTSLVAADRFVVEGDRLTLHSGADAWSFEPVPPVPTAELVGTTWQLDGYLDGDAVSNETGMDAATLTLHPDGTMSGTTNCRTLTGTWVESQSQVLLTEFTADGECPNPAAADLDNRIVGVLGDGFTVEIDGNRLTLTSQGGVGLTYTAG